MNTTRAIYIQGCARSGNTLIRELCVSSFQGAELVKLTKDQAECSLGHVVELLQQKADSRVWVASRNYENSLAMNREILRAHPEVKILWMLRDPRDVLTSTHPDQPGKFYVTPERWIKSLQLYEQFKDEPQVLTVRYEDLVKQPDVVQAAIAKNFNLLPVRKFVEAHKFFPRFHENVRAMHSIRPIDENSVQKWRKNPQLQQYLRQILAAHPSIVALACECGYDINAV
jgi:Sulfotransferase domain